MEQSFKRVAVVGCGLMGASWASLFLAHEIDVQAHDPASNSEDRLRHFVGHALAQLRELGRTGQGQLRFTPDLSQAHAVWGGRARDCLASAHRRPWRALPPGGPPWRTVYG